MEEKLELAARLGALEGTADALKERYHELSQILRSMDEKVSKAQIDLEGTAEQFQGQMRTVSTLETEFRRLESDLDSIKGARDKAWALHDEKCERCAERFVSIIKQTVVQAIVEHNAQVENLGVIALLKRYWWQCILIAVALSAFFELDHSFAKSCIKYFLTLR